MVFAACIGRAGDVEMRPGGSFYKRLQEGCRGRGAGSANGGDVDEIGVGRLHEFGVVRVQRHSPGEIAGFLSRFEKFVGQIVTIGEESRVGASQSHHAGTRERRDVDDELRLVFERLGEAVRENEPKLPVS